MDERIGFKQVQNAAQDVVQAMFTAGLIEKNHILQVEKLNNPTGYDIWIEKGFQGHGWARVKSLLDDMNWEGDSRRVYFQLLSIARTIEATAKFYGKWDTQR